MIELIDVVKHYRHNQEITKAIDGISLSIQRNEVFGIIGESGAGKSTLLRFINLLERPDQGQVFIEDVDILALNSQELRTQRKSMSMIFQQFNLLNNRTVAENICLPLKMHPYQDALNLDEVLEFVDLQSKKNQYPSQLSGGQKQRVGIARALITKPQILLCDEPTSALDTMMTLEIVNLLKQAHQKFDMTIVLVTHELDVVQQLCHRVALIESGRIIDVIDNNPDNQVISYGTYYDRVLEVLSK